RNRMVTGEFVLTTPNLGQNFAMGNHPSATGTYLPFKRGRSNAEHEQREWIRAAERSAGRPLTASEVSNYYLNSALDYIESNPAPWLKLTARKWLMVWNAYEAPDTEDYYLYKEWSPMLRFLDRLLHFGVLFPLAAAGCVMTWTRRRELWPLYGWLLITAVAVMIFVVFARYRFPLVPVLVLFAAAAVIDTARRLRGAVQKQAPSNWRAFAIPILALGGTALIANRTVLHERRPYPTSYTNHAVALADGGRFDEAIAELEKSFALAPDDVDAHLVMGSVLLDLHGFEAAASHYDRAGTGDPNFGGAFRGLGNALLGMGKFAEGAEEFKHALALDPSDSVALSGLATSIARQGRFNEAIDLFEQVLHSDPESADARLNQGNTYAAAGRLDDAASAYERLLRIYPRHADALNNLAAVEAGRGRYALAVGFYKRALKVEPDRIVAQRGLVAAMIGAGRRKEAVDFAERILDRDPSRTDLRRLLDN
ncbi:MAG: tetratricopeptide repeat protein, partial [Planctomycetota bacterium]|nr:tetratricopeptide repeat protein [Planctomycetota bacterium]